jgi:ADP-dependent NAD(P)H-hydrate dehydratase / NAD(P)H-hydrate epimerase
LSSSGRSLPALTSVQAREADRLSAERYKVPVEWLMEAAGWQLARHCRGRTLVCCGRGNNGGDGLAAARHLHRWGRLHAVACADPDRLAGPARTQLEALLALGVPVSRHLDLEGAQLVLDALFGTGLSRPPAGLDAEWIEAVNASGRRVVAADLPSGLDADSGRALGTAVRAHLTVTFGLPKAGLLRGDGPSLAGEVWLADVGIPGEAYAELGIQVPGHLFSMHDRLQLSALSL